MHASSISIADYTYELPDDRIALHPLTRRDASKLLVYKNESITESRFSQLLEFIPPKTLVVFNNSKVINARLVFNRQSGGKIELFLLEPAGKIQDYSSAMDATGSCRWKCFVGGAAKWKEPFLQKSISINETKVLLTATKQQANNDAVDIEFNWQPKEISFTDIVEAAGLVPLPPYIKRTVESTDKERYQTLFAKQQGSVAAPTASLHFSEEILEGFVQKNIDSVFVTLHVGAGTFKPVKVEKMGDHQMHAEYMQVDIAAIEKLRHAQAPICAAGTTAIRTIETLYWLGVKSLLKFPDAAVMQLTQWEVYEQPLLGSLFSMNEAFEALLLFMKRNNMQQIFTQTQLLIAPGYRFRVADMLITNFHQPQSTLLLLVAAAAGKNWRKLYTYALENDFRFLSYGDANLIFLEK